MGQPAANGRRGMNRRAFLAAMGVGAAACAFPRRTGAESPRRRPNILFLLTDDQSHEMIGALGTAGAHTPHMDRLAARGTAFTHAYNPGGWHGAICVASRTMLTTGAFLWRAQALDAGMDAEAAAGRTWPQRLAAAGFDTYFTGKWHVNVDPARVFGTVGTVRPGMPPDTPEAYGRPVEGAPDPWSPTDLALGGFWSGGRHWSETLADEAEAFLARAAERERPFFMYLAFNAPHDPRQSPSRWLDHYPLDAVPLPENFAPNYPHDAAIGCDPRLLRDERLAPSPRTAHAVATHRREYLAIVSHLDEQIGRILDVLERTGQADDTIVALTSDHGLAVGRHGFLGKQNMYDHSMRVPLVLRGPGIAAGARVAAPVYLQDIVPTTLGWAGACAEGVDFRPLQPLLEDPAAPHHGAILGAYMHLQRMVVLDGFKLIRYPGIGVTRMYHVETDPHETRDLADDPAHADTRAGLEAALRAEQRRRGDPLAD